MNGDDDFDVDEFNGPNQEEVQAIGARVIRDLQASRVCFYPGQQGNAPDFEDFIGALPLIGDCNALVYSEPRLTKVEVWQRVDRHRRNIQIPIPGLGFITEIEMVNTGAIPGMDRHTLFGQPVTEWISPDDGHRLAAPFPPPHDDRFWGEYCRLTISDRTVHLLHIGISGDAAWAYFFQPHGIQPARIIANPPYQGNL
jgi:hypothetical protein